jgi:glycosyltransferase involved in cell wall biosynthesis
VLENNIDLRGKPVRTIYNGVKLDFALPGARPTYIETDQFFFAIGVFRKKKNFEVLLPMMKYFANHQLIIAGDDESSYGSQIREQAETLGLTDRIILPGKVNDKDKSWLYQNCEAFMMPSLAEGFGLPVIEAMLAERPVFLNSIDTLQEIGGDVAYYFKDFNEQNMAEFVKHKLAEFNNTGQSDRFASHASKFSWKTCIEEYLKLYVEIMDN